MFLSPSRGYELIPRESDCLLYCDFNDRNAKSEVSYPLAPYSRSCSFSDGRLDGVVGEKDYAASFNGTSNKISWNGSQGLHGYRSFTVAAWIKLKKPFQSGVIAQRPWTDPVIGPERDGWMLDYRHSSKTIRFFVNGKGSVNGTLTADFEPDEAWHHIAARCSYSKISDRFVIRLYIDGEQIGLHSVVNADGLISNIHDGLIIGALDGPSGLNAAEINAVPPYFKGDIDNFVLYRSSIASSAIDSLYKNGWLSVTGDSTSGEFKIPVILNKVIYDPPGDQSYATMYSGQTYTSSMTTNWSFGTGISISAGLEGGFNFFGLGAGAGVEVSASVDFDVKNENRSEFTLKNEAITGTPDGENPDFMGPVKGDIIICKQQTFGWRMWRKLKNNYSRPIDDKDYEYTVTYWPIKNRAEDSHRTLSVASFIEEFQDDYPDIVASILDQLAIDPETGRVRQNLVSSGRLTGAQTDVWGSATQEVTWTSEISNSSTYTWDLNLQTDLGMSSKIGMLTTSVKASLRVGFGGSSTQGYTHTHSCKYRLSDSEGWDRYTITRYRDTRFGVWVFDVKQDESYASFPWVDDQALRAIDWNVEVLNSSSSASLGETAICSVKVTNTSPALSGAPGAIGVKLEKGDYPYTYNLPTGFVDINRGDAHTFLIELEAPEAGTYAGEFLFTLKADGAQMIETNWPDTTITVSGIFTPPDRGIYLGSDMQSFYVPNDQQSTVDRSFIVNLKNVGEAQETIQTGMTGYSVNTQTDYNPVSYNVEADGERSINVNLRADTPLSFPHAAVFWAQIEGYPETRRELSLSIDTIGSIVVLTPTVGDTITPLGKELITWRSTGRPLQRVRIEYLGSGKGKLSRWITIVDSLRTKENQYHWSVPFFINERHISLRITDVNNPSMRSTTISDIVVGGGVVDAAMGRHSRRPLNWVSIRSVGKEIRAMFGDTRIREITLFSPSGKCVATVPVMDGVARIGVNTPTAGTVLLVRWVSGDGTSRTRKVFRP